MSARAELLGQRFGSLVVLLKAGRTNVKPPRSIWLCRCDCGKERRVLTGQLRTGVVADCGQHSNPIPTGPQLSPVELAWAAGLFEGEGSVRINSATVRNLGALLVDVPNTDKALVAWFQERWPGYFRAGTLAGNRRPFWRWRVASLTAASFLVAIEPYVVGSKRSRVLLGIEYQRQKLASTAFNRDDDYRARQRQYFERMKALNERGAKRGAQLLLLPLAATSGRRQRRPETIGRLAGTWGGSKPAPSGPTPKAR